LRSRPQGVAHEQRLAQLAELGDLGRVGVGSLGGGHELATDLFIGPALSGLVHVNLDVVVGVGLGLRTGGHLLARVLRQVRLDRGVLDGLAGGHRDLLVGELVVHVVLDEVARHQQ
jgi:hypothetical protein